MLTENEHGGLLAWSGPKSRGLIGMIWRRAPSGAAVPQLHEAWFQPP